MTGNSRRQTPHHSAQKSRNTGLVSWESVKVSLPSSARARVKSGAGGPSGGGPGMVVSVGSTVVVVPASAELCRSGSNGGASVIEVDGFAMAGAEVVVAADRDCSITAFASMTLSVAVLAHEVATTAKPARTRERRFMGDTVPSPAINRTTEWHRGQTMPLHCRELLWQSPLHL